MNTQTFRRTIAVLLATGAMLTLSTPQTSAQSFPTKPVTIVAPFPAGGINDILARTLGQRLSDRWKQPVVVINKPGASGNIGAAQVSSAAADGHTLLLTAAAISTAPALYPDPGFRLFDTLTPVTVVGTVPFMLVVKSSLPINTVAEFVAYAKQNPGRLSLGSGGNGTIPHLAGELLKQRAGIQFVHVPYKGGIQAMQDLVAGNIDFTIDGGPHVVAQIRSGKARLIAVTMAKRLPQYPDVPTMAESGFPGFEAAAWQMVLVPTSAPADARQRIEADLRQIIADPQIGAWMEQQGVQAVGNSSTDAAEFLRHEMKTWSEVIRTAGVKVD